MNISDQFFKIGIFLADKRLACPVKFNDIFTGAICFYQNEFKISSFGRNYLTGASILKKPVKFLLHEGIQSNGWFIENK